MFSSFGPDIGNGDSSGTMIEAPGLRKPTPPWKLGVSLAAMMRGEGVV
jgi:hypothetical protein